VHTTRTRTPTPAHASARQQKEQFGSDRFWAADSGLDSSWQTAGLHLLGAGLGEGADVVQNRYLCNNIHGELYNRVVRTESRTCLTLLSSPPVEVPPHLNFFFFPI